MWFRFANQQAVDAADYLNTKGLDSCVANPIMLVVVIFL